MVVPNVPSILLKPYVRQVAGDTGGIVLVRVKPEDVETFRRDFRPFVFVALFVLGRPYVVLGIGILSPDGELAPFSYRLFIPFHLNRGNHGLTRKTEPARRTVIEHVPLSVALFDTPVGIMSGVGSL